MPPQNSRLSRARGWIVSRLSNRKSRRSDRNHLKPKFEVLEERIVLSLASPIDKLLASNTDSIAVKLARIDADNLADMVLLGRDGKLTVALNRGANQWQNVTAFDLALALKSDYFDKSDKIVANVLAMGSSSCSNCPSED